MIETAGALTADPTVLTDLAVGAACGEAAAAADWPSSVRARTVRGYGRSASCTCGAAAAAGSWACHGTSSVKGETQHT